MCPSGVQLISFTFALVTVACWRRISSLYQLIMSWQEWPHLKTCISMQHWWFLSDLKRHIRTLDLQISSPALYHLSNPGSHASSCSNLSLEMDATLVRQCGLDTICHLLTTNELTSPYTSQGTNYEYIRPFIGIYRENFLAILGPKPGICFTYKHFTVLYKNQMWNPYYRCFVVWSIYLKVSNDCHLFSVSTLSWSLHSHLLL